MMSKIRVFLALCVSMWTFAALGADALGLQTENVIFVMVDGLRWQEVFRGAEENLMNKENGDVRNVAGLKAKFWRDTPEERRKELLPFFWGEIASKGQIFGNKDKGSSAQVTNGLKFSFPGYSETLCGFADPKINSNGVPPNPNVTVLEWLHQKPAYQGKVAALGAWDAFDRIFNKDRCGFLVNCGFAHMPEDGNPQIALLNKLKDEIPRTWGGEPVDALTFHSALEYFKTHKPKVFFLSLGETDEWAHGGRYDEYLVAARRSDDYLRILWETAQSMPEYKERTTLIFSVDHGRGSNEKNWKHHSKDTHGAEDIWMAFMGPDTPAKGELTNAPDVKQNQIAATLAALLGEDYNTAQPKAGAVVPGVIGR